MLNRVKEILGIKFPVIQGAMAGISNAKLVAAVSEAGGLGTLQSAIIEKEDFEKEIEKTQELTTNPFAVNFPIARGEKVEELIEIALDKGVEIISLSAGNPKPFLDKLKKAKVSVQVIPKARLSKRMEDYGFDLIVVEGNESGGDVSINGTSTFSLIPNATDQVEIPVIAGGGIADKKTAAAAKYLGAEGIQMGTRFLASKECNIPEEVKMEIIERTADDIVKLRHGRIASNVIENNFTKKMYEDSENIPEIEMMERFKREKMGMYQGDIENGLIMAGQSIGRIKDIKMVKDIVKEIGEAFLSAC